jgi:hypothetical protein
MGAVSHRRWWKAHSLGHLVRCPSYALIQHSSIPPPFLPFHLASQKQYTAGKFLYPVHIICTHTNSLNSIRSSCAEHAKHVNSISHQQYWLYHLYRSPSQNHTAPLESRSIIHRCISPTRIQTASTPYGVPVQNTHKTCQLHFTTTYRLLLEPLTNNITYVRCWSNAVTVANRNFAFTSLITKPLVKCRYGSQSQHYFQQPYHHKYHHSPSLSEINLANTIKKCWLPEPRDSLRPITRFRLSISHPEPRQTSFLYIKQRDMSSFLKQETSIECRYGRES